MSRIGKIPVQIPSGVKVQLDNSLLLITGPKGTLSKPFTGNVKVAVEGDQVLISSLHNSKQAAADWGTTRSHISNMIKGVSEGWKKSLELEGAGYRAEVAGKDLKLTIGYSHPVIIQAPETVSFQVEKNTIKIESPNKELVGQVSAQIRKVRPPNPYTGKGIKFSDEIVKRKPGKAAGKTTAE